MGGRGATSILFYSTCSMLDTRSFAKRIDTIVRELQRAIKFDRPSIILAVYESELVRREVEAELSTRLEELGQRTERVQINEEKADVPMLLKEHPRREETVFFVGGIQWGGGKNGRNAYRALNMRREYFVDYRIQMVLWLTVQEAKHLPLWATDFWVFRHRTIEFTDKPQLEHVKKHAFDLMSLDLHSPLEKDVKAKIAYRERLLAELPDAPETRSTRVDVLGILGGLYVMDFQFDKGIEIYQQALTLTENSQPPYAQAHVWVGLGGAYYYSSQSDLAFTAYLQAIALNPSLATAWNGLGNVCLTFGRTDDAIIAYTKATELDKNNAYPWNGLGIAYAYLGQIDNARNAYEQAITLNPDNAQAWIGMGIVYQQIDRIHDALTAYQKALDLNPNAILAWHGIGNVYGRIGRTADAITAYQKSVELNSNYPFVHFNLGLLYIQLGAVNKAIAAFERAIELDPALSDRANSHLTELHNQNQ